MYSASKKAIVLQYPLRLAVSCVQPVTQQYNIGRVPCNQSSHYEIYGQFQLSKGSHHVLQPNQYISLLAKMKGHW